MRPGREAYSDIQKRNGNPEYGSRARSHSLWCPHANAETVLMVWDEDEYDHFADGRCDQCLREEYGRRHTGRAQT